MAVDEVPGAGPELDVGFVVSVGSREVERASISAEQKCIRRRENRAEGVGW